MLYKLLIKDEVQNPIFLIKKVIFRELKYYFYKN